MSKFSFANRGWQSTWQIVAITATLAGVTSALIWKRRRGRMVHAASGRVGPPQFPTVHRAGLPSDARTLFAQWLQEAEAALGWFPARCMALATADPDEGATVRTVVVLRWDVRKGELHIGTNRHSQKARQLNQDSRCECVFLWGGRQVRVRGRARLASADGPEASRLFHSLGRPYQLSLHIAEQGKALDEEAHQEACANLRDLLFSAQQQDQPQTPHSGRRNTTDLLRSRWVSLFGKTDTSQPLPVPQAYAALVISPDSFEFYQSGPPELGFVGVDRWLYTRQGVDFKLHTRLQA